MLWCDHHRELLLELAPGMSLQLVAARLMETYSQSTPVQAVIFHDPYVSELGKVARFLGVVMATRCICCQLGEETVERVFGADAEPGPGFRGIGSPTVAY